MAQRVDLDAMIPREDFAVLEETFALDLMSDFPLRHLAQDAPVMRLLRKPDFQRETNHWSPEQFVTFIESFLDNEVIPSLILWKAPRYIFVIDGGHRLSALRAWMEDDYGDRHISRSFYKAEIPRKQLMVADKTRKLVEKKVGRYTQLRSEVNLDAKGVLLKSQKRANLMEVRALPLQWVQGNAGVAESSFFKINSQGTPLDDTETLLIKNRRKPIAISARAILRAGSGHKYWSGFAREKVEEIESITSEIHETVFKPEADEPLKTLELPLGGAVSPVDALSLLIEFLTISGTRNQVAKQIDQYDDDITGDDTIAVLKHSFYTLNRISGNRPGSLGLHPAVYFYNERGKYSRFLFLGMAAAVHDKVKNNNSAWFKQFTQARRRLESFLIANKSVLGIILQNLAKGQRIPKIRELIEFLVSEMKDGKDVRIEDAIGQLGLKGRIIDVKIATTSQVISDDTKTIVFLKQALARAIPCTGCGGLLDTAKSMTYDHVNPKRDGGLGSEDNVQLMHPFCNSGVKN